MYKYCFSALKRIFVYYSFYFLFVSNFSKYIRPEQMYKKVILAGKIYVIGGFTGESVLASAEVYDPTLNVWQLLPEMTTPRSGVRCVTLRKHIYAIGVCVRLCGSGVSGTFFTNFYFRWILWKRAARQHGAAGSGAWDLDPHGANADAAQQPGSGRGGRRDPRHRGLQWSLCRRVRRSLQHF